jgi:hypothetical protein
LLAGAASTVAATTDGAGLAAEPLTETKSTRIGDLHYEVGVPTAETVNKLYDEMDSHAGATSIKNHYASQEGTPWVGSQSALGRACGSPTRDNLLGVTRIWTCEFSRKILMSRELKV